MLDIIANFIVFDVEDGKRVKKVARYHQFRAANKIVGRALGVEHPSGGRRGIVWHTQGSGKSLTMIFAARKQWNHPTLQQPTLVIVVDREQLELRLAALRVGTYVAKSVRSSRSAMGSGTKARVISRAALNRSHDSGSFG